MFMADPFAEYEAREGLKDGVLSRHENKGQTPFEQLLSEVKASPN